MICKSKLIEEITPLLKQMGYKKRGFTWIKQNDDVYTVFNIQGSQYDKNYYYINLGICIKKLYDTPTKIADCQIIERVNENVIEQIDSSDIIISIVNLWNDKYDNIKKLKEKAYEHKLPTMTRSDAVTYLLTVK